MDRGRKKERKGIKNRERGRMIIIIVIMTMAIAIMTMITAITNMWLIMTMIIKVI